MRLIEEFMIYGVEVVWVYLGQVSIVVAAIFYALARRNRSSHFIVVGLALKVATEIADWMILRAVVNAGRSIDDACSTQGHIIVLLLSYVGLIMAAGGFLAASINEFKQRKLTA